MNNIISIGALLIKSIVRIKMRADKVDLAVDIVDLFKDMGLDELDARKAERKFSEFGDDIAKSCSEVLNSSKIKEERRPYIIEQIINSYNKCNLGYNKMIALNFDAFKINKELLQYEDYKEYLDLNEAEIYERLISHTSNILVNIVTTFPDFTSNGVKTLLQMFDSLSDKVDKILFDISNINVLVEDKENETRNFEREYRNKVKEAYGYINLFGANSLSREFKRYELSIAYVELEASIDNNNDSKVIPISDIFKKSDVVWVVGEAGSGKTTFLQWLAVNSATDTVCEIKEISGNLPIFMELRSIDYSNLGLKQVVDALMRNSSYNMPNGWIENILLSGEVLLLIDGLDEISYINRAKVFNWIEDIYKKYKVRIAVTARPSITERFYISQLEVKILPMSSDKIDKFIAYWHKAILAEKFMVDQEEVVSTTRKTLQKIQSNESIYTLTTNPLLCAMICALHYKNGLVLPNDKKELYEDCCKMLIDNRDNEKEIQLDIKKLSYDQKKIILGQMAYWMLKNGHVVISKKAAIESVERSIGSMNLINNVDLTAEKIFGYLMERSGILREPQVGKIDFIHKTFQEFLAAYEISRQDDFLYLASNVGNENWHETIVIGVGFANIDKASKMIEKILQNGKDAALERKYLFIATACASNAVQLDTELRTKIENSVKKLIPPAMSECKQLAEAGGFVVPFLKYTNLYDTEAKVSCLRTLRYIGSPQALRTAISYINDKLEKESLIELGKLLRIYNMSELLTSGIETVVYSFIVNTYKNGVLEVPEIFIKIIENVDDDRKKAILKLKINTLILYDYDGIVNSYILKIFKGVKNITIYGNFNQLPVLNYVKELREIELRSENDKFSIYKLRSYNSIFGVSTFKMDITYGDFINGDDLPFLVNVKELELNLINSCVELYFDQFDNLHNIQKLTIISDYGSEFCYNNLIYSRSLKELNIFIPDNAAHILAFDINLTPNIDVYINNINIEEICKKEEMNEMEDDYDF